MDLEAVLPHWDACLLQENKGAVSLHLFTVSYAMYLT